MANSGLGTAAGPDITLSRCLGPCWDVEARYFQVDGWRDANVFSVNSPGRVIDAAYGTSFSAQSVSLDYSSRLYNVELNLRWKRCEAIPVLIGFRTLGLDERFRSSSLAGARGRQGPTRGPTMVFTACKSEPSPSCGIAAAGSGWKVW